VLKQDLQEQIKELKSQLEFSKDLLEKKIEDNFKLRQQILKLENKKILPQSISESKI
jgi:hypothetical protein